jgi:hypothetical protein
VVKAYDSHSQAKGEKSQLTIDVELHFEFFDKETKEPGMDLTFYVNKVQTEMHIELLKAEEIYTDVEDID